MRTTTTTAATAPARPRVPRVGARLVAALRELDDALAAGRDPAEVFTSRTYRVPDPPAYGPAAVRRLRARLGLSQPVFAALVGASVPLVQGWEQGKRVPNPMARRLLQGIDHDPARWLALAGPVARPRPPRRAKVN